VENSDAAFVVSCILQIVGFGAAISQVSIFRTYRHLRNLALHGVEGEAVSVGQEYAGSGKYRVSYEIRPAGSGSPAVFREVYAGMREAGETVPVVYDRRKPRRARTGFLGDIDYRAERLSVFVLGYGGAAVYVVGLVLLILN
jgi:hypothetical protein